MTCDRGDGRQLRLRCAQRLRTRSLVALFIFGGAVWAQGMDWVKATDSAPWHGREVFASVTYNGHMWIFGGMTSNGWVGNDVWQSQDGVTWTEATDSAGWRKREGHAAIVFDNKMWVLGGYGADNAPCHDVWWSSDGVNWVCATDSAGWFAGSSFVTFGGKMWLLGGVDSSGLRKDVWSSVDGTNWILECDSAGWSRRGFQTSVVYNGQILVMGGADGQGHLFGDVWSSSDGRTWSRLADSAGWGPRYAFAAVVHESTLWVMGGWSSRNLNDVWCSTNGRDWTKVADSTSWARRSSPAALTLNGKMWILGGITDSTNPRDVWYSTGLGVDEEPTSEQCSHDVRLGPNPFRNRVDVWHGTSRNSTVKTVIRDCTGAVARELVFGVDKSGAYTASWDGRDRQGRSVPAGVYLVVICDEGRNTERKLVKLP